MNQDLKKIEVLSQTLDGNINALVHKFTQIQISDILSLGIELAKLSRQTGQLVARIEALERKE